MSQMTKVTQGKATRPKVSISAHDLRIFLRLLEEAVNDINTELAKFLKSGQQTNRIISEDLLKQIKDGKLNRAKQRRKDREQKVMSHRQHRANR